MRNSDRLDGFLLFLPRLSFQHLEHGALAGVLRRRTVETWLEGIASQLFSVVGTAVILSRFGGLIYPQSPPLGQRGGWG